MAALELRLLGALEVLRDGEPLELPPSRKTRALLAFLALQRRSFRRERLCSLFWEIPDDPRGSLRWSLSKLRRLVDDEHRPRILADRNAVSFDATDVEIDVVALRAVAGRPLEECPVERLEQAAARYRGHLLEGLELPDFHEFDAWCFAERDAATRAQVSLLAALTQRLAASPERAVPHARAWVTLAPLDENARAVLIALLVALGSTEQAEQHADVGTRLLREAGIPASGALTRALRSGIAAPLRARVTTAEVGATSMPLAVEPPPNFPRSERAELSTVAPSVRDSGGPRDAAGSSALLGREAEVSRIDEMFRAALAKRQGRLLLVRGEPGIGKSRLLEAAAARAQELGALRLEASAYASESIRPFGLWIDALRRIDPQAAIQVFERNDRGNRDALFSGLCTFLGERAEHAPIVLLLDDLQWADDSSAAALHYLARTHRDQPLLGVLAAREDELRDNRAMLRAARDLRQAGLLEEVKLGPLPEDAVRALIRDRAPGADGDRLSKACGGNPLLAIELARAEVAGDSGRSLAELVAERLARFDLEGGEIIRWAAVLAPRIDATMLARVTGLDWNRIAGVLETAAAQSMLRVTDRGYRFSHDLIAHGIYAEISPVRRRMMHRHLAELLEQETAIDLGHASDLAHHASQSGDARLSARAMVSAGRLCLRFFAHDEAGNLSRRGLAYAEQLPDAERICLTLELREIMMGSSPPTDWEAHAVAYTALAEQALDHGALSHARLGYMMASTLRWRHGHWAGAREQILQSERVTRSGTPEEHIVGMAEAARCLAMLERDLSQADAMLMEARSLAERNGFMHHAIPAALGMLHFHRDELEMAADYFKQARTLAKTAGVRGSEYQATSIWR